MKKEVKIELTENDCKSIQTKIAQNSDNSIFIRLAHLCNTMSCEMQGLFLDNVQSPPGDIEQLFATLQLYSDFVIRKMGLSEENIQNHINKSYLKMYSMDVCEEGENNEELDKFSSLMERAQRTIDDGEKAVAEYAERQQATEIFEKHMFGNMMMDSRFFAAFPPNSSTSSSNKDNADYTIDDAEADFIIDDEESVCMSDEIIKEPSEEEGE